MKKDGKISEDMPLIWWNVFTKMWGVFGGEQIGSDDNGELYKGTIYFMIAGLKESTHVIKTSPQITINAVWFRDELFECLDAQTE